MSLSSIRTPALLLDKGKMERNIDRLDGKLAGHSVALRPHVKTAKSVDAVAAMTSRWSGALTVSTLKEAEMFLAAGYRDLLYAVGIAPNKLPHAAALIAAGADLCLILDSADAARAVAQFGAQQGLSIPVLIEVDTDGNRAGVAPSNGALLIEIASLLSSGAGTQLRGVMTHGGASYSAADEDGLIAHAELERAGAVAAAGTLRAAGFETPVVSVGSTPTAFFARDLTGVTEVRAGVYVFFDLVMSGLGVCTRDEIALSVLTSVIGHQKEKGWILVDAGWTALSRDAGRWGYGMVCDSGGRQVDDLVVSAANQEHGIVTSQSGSLPDPGKYPVGTLLRILPNHACATAAQHDRYHVLGKSGGPETVWRRFGGW